MNLIVFDSQLEACFVWQEMASVQGLTFSSFQDAAQLKEQVDIANILVIDQSVLPTGFLSTVADLCKRRPTTQVIATGGSLRIADVVELMQAGASSLYEKPLEERLIASDLPTIIEHAKRREAECEEFERLDRLFSGLTVREKDVLNNILSGTSNKETAKLLSVSVRTVESRRAKVYRKLEAENLADLVRRVDRLEQLQHQFGSHRAQPQIPSALPHRNRPPHFPSPMTSRKFIGC